MSSNMQNPSSKGGGPAMQLPSTPQISTSNSQADGHSRRIGGSGTYGAGASTRSSSSPRNSQTMRRQHKGRRPKLGIDDPAIEAAATRSTNSRKGQTSITHLMNFSLPPRPQNSNMHHQNRHVGSKRPTWGLGSGYHAADKARYIHANYRFIVDPDGDYRQHAVDPDIHVDWSNVLQILASASSQATNCPICLSTPVAPRMAKCGHIFCLPCMIRFMNSSEDSQAVPEKKTRWKSCPICWDNIYMNDMRPVRWYQGQEGDTPVEGDDVILRLIMRQPGSVIALPRDEARSLQNREDVPWHFSAEVMDYARIMKGSAGYMLSNFDNEIAEIQQQEQEDQLIFGEGSQWTKRAVSAITDMKEKCRAIGTSQIDASTSDRDRMPKNIYGEKQTLLSSITSGVESSSQAGFFYYQALLQYYLSPLDIRILKAAFGEYANFPGTILPRVERVSTGHSVDDDLRKRAKYLGHLPSGCEVGFLECNWTDVVPPKVLETFSSEIERRRKRNREKEAREEKERLRAEKEEDDKRWAIARRRKTRESSPNGFEGHSQQDWSLEPPNFGSSAASSSHSWSTSPRREGSAFASLASPSTSPSAPRTVWGTAAVTQPSPQLPATQDEDLVENDGWLQGWEKDLLCEENQLVAQVETASLNSSSILANATGGGKKKKNKKITLMSTNARRAA